MFICSFRFDGAMVNTVLHTSERLLYFNKPTCLSVRWGLLGFFIKQLWPRLAVARRHMRQLHMVGKGTSQRAGSKEAESDMGPLWASGYLCHGAEFLLGIHHISGQKQEGNDMHVYVPEQSTEKERKLLSQVAPFKLIIHGDFSDVLI